MSDDKRPWWRAFDKVERKVGEPLEDLVASPRYTDVMVTAQKLRRAVGGVVGGVASGAIERVLHVVQIPTRGDVSRLTRQMTALTGEIRELKGELDGRPNDDRKPASKQGSGKAAPRKAKAKRDGS